VILPAAAVFDIPVPISIAPDEPELEVPDVKEIAPLLPTVPAFGVLIVIAPLVLEIT
jgi:hypothetical protein